MKFEIERRFLPANNDWKELVEREIMIKQGYLAKSDGNTVRIRSSKEDEDVEYVLEAKGGRNGLLVREPSGLLTPDEFREFAALCGNRWTVKRRSVIAELMSNIEFHIDEFCGQHKPLTIIEVEYASINAFKSDHILPEWVGVEITDSPEMSNYDLAVNGLPVYMQEIFRSRVEPV